MNKGAAALMTLVLLSTACKSGRPITLINREVPARSAEKIIERLLARDPRAE